MSELLNEIVKHPRVIIEILAAYWGFSALVSGMPMPKDGQFWYQWMFTSLHTFSGSIRTAVNDPRLATLLQKQETRQEQIQPNTKKEGEQ